MSKLDNIDYNNGDRGQPFIETFLSIGPLVILLSLTVVLFLTRMLQRRREQELYDEKIEK